MTRYLLNSNIPLTILTPAHTGLGAPSRKAPVVGHCVITDCPNPDCRRVGPMDALILGPGNEYPNFVVICGDSPSNRGCGLWWSQIGAAPSNTAWVEPNVQPI